MIDVFPSRRIQDLSTMGIGWVEQSGLSYLETEPHCQPGDEAAATEENQEKE
jgi:hypothetical protein